MRAGHNWTKQEDDYLKSIVSQGKRSWIEISNNFNQKYFQRKKTPKQCRERFINYCTLLGQDLQIHWSLDDVDKMFELYEKWGSRWTKIAPCLKGKTQNTVKNKFYCCLRKLKRKMNFVGKRYSLLKKQLKEKSIIRILDSLRLITLPNDLKSKGAQIRKNIIKLAHNTQDQEQIISDEKILQLINDINRFNLESRSFKFWKNKSNDFDGLSQMHLGQIKVREFLVQKNELNYQNSILAGKLNQNDQTPYLVPNVQSLKEQQSWSEILFNQDMISSLAEEANKQQKRLFGEENILNDDQSLLGVKDYF